MSSGTSTTGNHEKAAEKKNRYYLKDIWKRNINNYKVTTLSAISSKGRRPPCQSLGEPFIFMKIIERKKVIFIFIKIVLEKKIIIMIIMLLL